MPRLWYICLVEGVMESLGCLQGMDLAVNLQLFESRCQELQGRLEVPRQELLISLEISAEYTQSCFELHTYMSDVYEKIQTSKKKVAEAQVCPIDLATFL